MTETVTRGGRRLVIGVMGSGDTGHEDLAAPLGRWIAREGYHLLTGGGGGVMAAVSEAFRGVADRSGLVIGVLPGEEDHPVCRPPPGYPNCWVELAVSTHLPLRAARGTSSMSRNHINVLTSDVVIGLPGGEGTASEMALAVRYARPCIAFLSRPDQMPDFPAEVSRVTALDDVVTFVRRISRRAAG